ncbi:MAG: aminoglycoside phosphotransferase [Pseudomonadales bacterium]|nr:aminoglycoside phosphotransferase [Pseudomonadales bacterium]
MDQHADQRLAGLSAWVNHQLARLDLYKGPSLSLETVSGDASFRRYFRCRYPVEAPVKGQMSSLICVDAPPDKENNPVFIKVDDGFAAAGVPVPRILATDLEQGFMLLSDMGDLLLKQVLNEHTAEHFFGEAFRILLDIMAADFSQDPLPPYDSALLQREMELFRDWFCGTFLQLDLNAAEHQLLTDVFRYLEQLALAQKQVPVHRDYHTRNLMVLEDRSLGVIDFQDAVFGPITYDVLSLLRDETFATWDQQLVKRWVLEFAVALRDKGVSQANDQRLWQDFNAIGAQRHLKVAGIFARLRYRDQKSGYLEHTPQSLQYVLMEIRALQAMGPDCLKDFDRWLRERVVPALAKHFPQVEHLIEAVPEAGF